MYPKHLKQCSAHCRCCHLEVLCYWHLAVHNNAVSKNVFCKWSLIVAANAVHAWAEDINEYKCSPLLASPFEYLVHYASYTKVHVFPKALISWLVATQVQPMPPSSDALLLFICVSLFCGALIRTHIIGFGALPDSFGKWWRQGNLTCCNPWGRKESDIT